MTDQNEGQPGNRLLDLDADIQPTGGIVRIGGREHHFKTDDELTIADRENLLLFSLRLREIRQTEPEGNGLLPDEIDARIVDMQRRILRIALPTVPRGLLDELDPIKVHAAVGAFMQGISITSWMHWTTRQWILTSLVPQQLRNRLTGTDTAASESSTPASKPDSDADTALTTGEALTG